MRLAVRVLWGGGGKGIPGTLTTEHSQSSYGLPVLVAQGQVYGTGDLPFGTVLMPWDRRRRLSQEERDLFEAAQRAGYTVRT